MDPGSLDALRDIVSARPPGLWPLAPGWVVVLGAALVLCLWLAWRGLVRWRAAAYRRAALAELAGATTVPEIAALLKRAALAAFGRSAVASLTGASWLAFLQRTAPSVGFAEGPGRRLPELTYDAQAAAALPASELEALRGAVAEWVRRHEVRSC